MTIQQFVRNDEIIPALLASGHLTTGNKIPNRNGILRKPLEGSISIEEANECTDNYSKKLCTNENPYYYIESDDINNETGHSIPGLDAYNRITGKPIVTQLQNLQREWQMAKDTKLPVGWKPEACDPERTAHELRMTKFVILD